jgi:hypothetical protein
MKLALKLLAVIIIAIAAFFYFKPFAPEVRSKILQKETIIKIAKDGTTTIMYPIASLPQPEAQSEWVVVQGNVVQVPSNPADKKSGAIIALETDKALVIATNILYVHALERFYIGKTVKLVGRWGKDVVIFGRKYPSFWIEDISLVYDPQK